jgi:ABC-type branched-subunit amino acid transport system substrate-binding protein
MDLTNATGLLVFGALLLAGVACDAAELTEIEARGKQIYVTGTSPSGQDIVALVGVDGFELPASSMTCSSCHGLDGRGRPEGGVVPSDITWAHLTKAYGHDHSYGRQHPAFDKAGVEAAIRTGVDPAGNRLDLAMPAFRMEDDDLAALIAYLQRIETDYDPGVTPETLRIATLLPDAGPMAPLGAAMRGVLGAYVASVNAGGGINGRRLELEVIAWGASPESTLQALESRTAAGDVFALLSPFSAGIETELVRLAEDYELPVIAPYTLQPPPASALERYTFRLFPGGTELVRVLVEEIAGGSAGADPDVLVSGTDDAATEQLAAAVDKQLRRRNWRDAERELHAPGTFDTDRIADRLQDSGARAMFFFGTPDELERLLSAASERGITATIAIPPDRVTPSLFAAAAGFDGRILSAFPRSPADVTPAGQKAYAALREYGELAGDHAAAQLAVLAAAKTFGEGIMRAGKHLSRESFVAALEGLNNFETGLAPPLSFSLNRRVGALGAHVVRVDPEKQSFVPEGAWKSLK